MAFESWFLHMQWFAKQHKKERVGNTLPPKGTHGIKHWAIYGQFFFHKLELSLSWIGMVSVIVARKLNLTILRLWGGSIFMVADDISNPVFTRI